MSYIRSTSNPEGLYIFGTEYDVEICVGSEDALHIPLEIFDKLIVAFIDGYCEDCEYCGATIKEDWIAGEFKCILAYDNWSVEMWYVTWYYIAQSNYVNAKRYLRRLKRKRFWKFNSQ